MKKIILIGLALFFSKIVFANVDSDHAAYAKVAKQGQHRIAVEMIGRFAQKTGKTVISSTLRCEYFRPSPYHDTADCTFKTSQGDTCRLPDGHFEGYSMPCPLSRYRSVHTVYTEFAGTIWCYDRNRNSSEIQVKMSRSDYERISGIRALPERTCVN